jgi:hypothetical protein
MGYKYLYINVATINDLNIVWEIVVSLPRIEFLEM